MKKIYLLVIVLLIFISVSITFKGTSKNDNLQAVETELDILENVLKNYKEFSNSKIKKDEEKQVLTINQKYDIFLKKSYYLMNIKNKKDEFMYCQIVDAIETSLGLNEGESLNTCLDTIKGKINLGEINVEFYNDQKVLTVKNDEPAKLYNPDRTHQRNELISIDEINYDIKFDNYLITSLTTIYDEKLNQLNICGNIWNDKKKKDILKLKLYDENKNELNTENFNYENENNKKFKTTCINIPTDKNEVKYFSLNN